MDERAGMVFHQLLRAHHNACMAALARQGAGDVGSPRLLVALSQYPDGPDQAPTQRELADRLHNRGGTRRTAAATASPSPRKAGMCWTRECGPSGRWTTACTRASPRRSASWSAGSCGGCWTISTNPAPAGASAFPRPRPYHLPERKCDPC